ncbi:long-chain-fatty-acid--CoA ligase [Ranunculus cassubicifolius]
MGQGHRVENTNCSLLVPKGQGHLARTAINFSMCRELHRVSFQYPKGQSLLGSRNYQISEASQARWMLYLQGPEDISVPDWDGRPIAVATYTTKPFVSFILSHHVLTCLPRCTSYLKTIVSFGKVTDAQRKEAEGLGVSIYAWKEFASLVTPNENLPVKTKSDICTIMYTSGTTGEPKGVLLSNEAMMESVLSTDKLLIETDKPLTEDDCYFSFLPLAHVFDQIMETYCIYKGASIGFFQGDVCYLMEDLQLLKPTMFCGVPRIFDRIYTGTQERISSGGGLKKILYQYAYSYKLKSLEAGLRQDEAAPLFDKLVFNKIKQVLGGRVRIIISGAAPLSRHVEEFLRVTCCSILSQGYGLTESCPGCFTSIANVHSMIGTVGGPVVTIEARLESVPEMGYDALATVPRGEICIRGKSLFSGYHKRPDLTHEVVVDGWFHTGDIGEWQPNGAMKIIDRKKNIFKLSQGEYVAVENLESTFGQCPLITAIWVYGNNFESFLVAVVVPEKKVIEDWAASQNETGDFQSLCEHPKARKYIMDELNSIGRKNNNLTPTLSKCTFLLLQGEKWLAGKRSFMSLWSISSECIIDEMVVDIGVYSFCKLIISYITCVK